MEGRLSVKIDGRAVLIKRAAASAVAIACWAARAAAHHGFAFTNVQESRLLKVVAASVVFEFVASSAVGVREERLRIRPVLRCC